MRTGISSSIYLFLVYLGVGLVGPPFLSWNLGRKCAQFGLDEDHCNYELGGDAYLQAAAAAASFFAVYSLSLGLLQVLMCAFYGVISDAYGRRLVLILPQIGGALSALSLVLFDDDLTLCIIAGCCSALGGQYVTNHAAMSTLADMTQRATPAERSKVFGMVEAMNWGGLLVGPLLGGVLADALGNTSVFIIIASLNVANICVTFFTYKETLEPERRRPFQWSRGNPLAALGLFFHSQPALCLGGLFFGGMFSMTGASNIMGLYAMNAAGFGQLDLGLMGTFMLGSGCLGLLFVLPCLAKYMKLTHVMTISLFWQAIIWLVMSVSRTKVAIFVVLGCCVLNAVYFPIVRAGLTNIFGKRRYGEALAAIGTLEQGCDMLGKVAFNSLYSATQHVTFNIGPLTMGCISFPICSGIALIGAAFSLFLRDIPKNVEQGDQKEDDFRTGHSASLVAGK
jgi:DHA1 family tetracycline resistance protein-like MFS transporter